MSIAQQTFLYNEEAEQMLLGILLVDPDLIKETKIKPHQLTPGQHHNILWALQDLDQKGIPVNLVSIMESIGKNRMDKVGGPAYLAQLKNAIPSTISFVYYENIILEYYQKREALKVADKIKESVFGEDPTSSIRTGINELMQLEDISGDDDDGSIKDDLVAIYTDMETPKGEITGIPTGFKELDRITAGLQKQDFIVVAARPSVGKTAFALNIAESVAKQTDYAVGVFSLEMSRPQLLKRMVSSNGRINSQSIRTCRITGKEWPKLSMALGDIGMMNLLIFDKPGVDVNYIWAKARRMKRDYKGKDILIMIDYLQLISGSEKHKGNRTQEISEISRLLKHMARELDITVIALSQLSRAVEQRQNKRPMMSDIRESGQIEQDADVIAFLYRDDYYDKDSEYKDIIEIIIGKQRNGPTGTVQLAFIKDYNLFVNLERRHESN